MFKNCRQIFLELSRFKKEKFASEFCYPSNPILTSPVPVRPCCCVFDWRETPWMSGRDHQLCGRESGTTSFYDTHRLVRIYLLTILGDIFDGKSLHCSVCFDDAFNPAWIAATGDSEVETSDAPPLSHCSALTEWGSAAALAFTHLLLSLAVFGGKLSDVPD